MERFTQWFFSRPIALIVLLGSSASTSISFICMLFGIDAEQVFVVSLTIMIAYFSIAIWAVNEERKANRS